MTSCPQCGKPLVSIEMQIDGKAVTMRSCSPCELRWWNAGGTAVDLTEVLDIVANKS